MPLPTDQGLYDEVKDMIMSNYKKSSAYSSGAIVKNYKKQFAEKYGDNVAPYQDDNKPKNLKRWFKEEWIDINPVLGIHNDNAYPVFRPTKYINSNTPTLLQEIPIDRLKEQYKLKQKIKGEENLPNFIPKIVVHNGGKLAISTFKNLLTASYDKKTKNVDGFIQDESLSTKTSKVYYNPETGQSVVAHRGTSGFTDWFNNAVYAYGGEKLYKMTPRYKEAERVQKEASKKYGNENLTTIGHSQGGLQSELLGGESNEVITLNKATRPFSNHKNENQFDIRTSGDVVLILNPFQPKNYNEIIIPSKTSNPLTEHGIETLERLEGDRIVGKSIGGMIVRSFYNHPDNK